MPIIVVSDEKNLADLTGRLLKASTSKAATARARAAIVEANPGLDLDDLRPGDVVVVPTLAESKAARATGDVVEPTVNDLLALAGQGVVALMDRAAADAGEAQSERADTMAALTSPELAQVMRGNPQLRQRVAGVEEAMKDDDQRSAQDLALLQQAAGRWIQQLEKLRQLIE